MELKQLRKKLKKTQEEVANELRIKKQNYQNYELGKREPDIETLCKLAKYFNCSLDELVGIKKERPELTERNTLLNKINLLTEIECHKLNIFADGLISNRNDNKKEITLRLIKDIENEGE